MTQYHWIAPKKSNQDGLINKILDRRGHTAKFLEPTRETVHSPWQLHDMQKAVNRINQAIDNQEKITIYGDYDADGITSTTVMYEVLRTLGADVHYYIPNRFTDGYGPSLNAYQRIVNDGTKLIVTVDNGVSGKDVIDPIVKESGVDVVITDHHELPDQLPTKAQAIVHPRFPGSNYPFGDLSGVGVAFKVAWALLNQFPTEYLDLVAIGEIADVVSVTDENRYLIQHGIKILSLGLRPGIKQLLKITKLDGQQITSTDIGFTIAPRLNSLGRIQDASLGVKLLSTNDLQTANEIVNQMEELNSTRQMLVKQITKEAVKQAQDNPHKILLIHGHNWHQGVLGIVASQIMDKFQKPCLVISQSDGQDIAKGSGRSMDGFDLYQALNPHRDLMTSFGGHPGACGLSMPLANCEKMEDALDHEAINQNFDPNKVKPDLHIDAVLKPTTINVPLINQLEKLGPFGPTNQEPIIETLSNRITNLDTMGQDDSHLRFTINGLKIVGFGMGKDLNEIQTMIDNDQTIKLVGTLNINRWMGKESAQLMLTDFKAV